MLTAAVLGSPVVHSLSPVLHRAGYAALGLTEWEYAAYDVTEDLLGAFIAGLGPDWRGLSLTRPLKVAAFDVASTVDDVARATHAINTLVRRDDGGWSAFNTDVTGIERALTGAPRDDAAVIIGSGATARSAWLALSRLGARTVTIAARSPHRAAWVTDVATPGQEHHVVPIEDWAAAPGLLVVSTVPPAADEAVAAALDGERREGTLLDVVYDGWPTPLARAAGAAGMNVVSGFEMLVHQAVEQFELFTGHRAPTAAMHAAGLAALRRRQG